MAKNTRVNKVDLSTLEGIAAAKDSGRISPQSAAEATLKLAKQRAAFTFAEDEAPRKGLKIKVNPPGTSSKGRHYGATVSVSTGGFGAGASLFLSPAQVSELIGMADDLRAAAAACETRYGNKVGA